MAGDQQKAIAAASASADATAELLRFSREGGSAGRAFDPLGSDPIAGLADALAIAIEIEDSFLCTRPECGEERELAGQLLAAVRKWQRDAGAS